MPRTGHLNVRALRQALEIASPVGALPIEVQVVSGSGVPPADGTRSSVLPSLLVLLLGRKVMVPSSDQLPPRPFGASHSVTAAPPLTAIFFNFPLAKKATHCPSGEKNGPNAPSVPASAVA